MRSVLVIGGGIAGLSAAWELSRLGVHALLIEQGPFIGGHAAHLTCKATERCLKCNGCLVEDRLKAVSEERPFDIRVGTELISAERRGAGFIVSVRSGARWIDPEKCTDCGKCFDAFPHLVIRAPTHHARPAHALDLGRIESLDPEELVVLRAVCPQGAVDLTAKETEWSAEVGGVIVASGYQPFDPKALPRYGLGRLEGVLTGMDAERMLREEGRIVLGEDGGAPEKIAFVQCVGSRDPRVGREYCSRVCCGYALRMGLRIVHEVPETQVTVFYMDIQNFGKDFERHFEEARSRLRLLRGLPGDYYLSQNGRVSVGYFEEKGGTTVKEDFDLVILSVGMSPAGSNPSLAEKLGLGLSEGGFFVGGRGQPAPGVVIAGSAEGPMDVSETISHAKRAALEMAAYLRDKGYR